MDMKARKRAYDEMVKDPAAFLQTHYGVTPQMGKETIHHLFVGFAGATGVGADTIEQAVDDFVRCRLVHAFVLQAASAEKSCVYANAKQLYYLRIARRYSLWCSKKRLEDLA